MEASNRKSNILNDAAYNSVKEKIITCEYRPGQWLAENFLTEDLKIGRTPIREALRSLEREGLVRIVPRCGTFVTEISVRDIKEMYQIREIIECQVLRITVTEIEIKDLEKYERLYHQTITNTNEVRQQLEEINQDLEFHLSLVKPLRNHRLEAFLESIFEQHKRVMINAFRNRLPDQIHQEHLEIIYAIKKRDPETACRAMQKHIRNSVEAATKIL